MSQQIKRLEHRIKKYDRLVSEWEDTVTLCEMAQEEDDASCLLYTSGTVRNVVYFGVFVDIGVHQDGLVHISQVCNKFIRHPSEVVLSLIHI